MRMLDLLIAQFPGADARFVPFSEKILLTIDTLSLEAPAGRVNRKKGIREVFSPLQKRLWFSEFQESYS